MSHLRNDLNAMAPDEYRISAYHHGFDLIYPDNLQINVADDLIHAGYRIGLIYDPTTHPDFIRMKKFLNGNERQAEELIRQGYRVALIPDENPEPSPSVLTPLSPLTITGGKLSRRGTK